MTLVSTLERLVPALVAEGSRVADYLRSGLSADEVRASISAAGVEAHDDVVALFSWHDGLDMDRLREVATHGVPPLMTYFEFVPLGERLDELNSEWYPEVVAEYGWLGKNWFPVMGGAGGDQIYVSNDADDPGSVWYVTWEDQPIRKYDSLEEMFADALGEMERGCFERDQGGNPMPCGERFWSGHPD